MGPAAWATRPCGLLANSLSQQVKQQFVIENRPSAGGIISMTEVLRAPADGYTLGEMGNGQAISMSLFSNLHYDLLRDFTPISVAASFAMLLAVPDRSPYKSLPAAGRGRPQESGQDQSGRDQSRQHAKPVDAPFQADHRGGFHHHSVSHRA